MDYKAEKVGHVEDLGDIYRVGAPLDKQLEAFQDVGIHTLASPEEIAQIRLAGIPDTWSRTSVAPLARKGARTILVKGNLNPLMNPLLAGSAVKAHKKGEYLKMDGNVYEAAEAIAKREEESLELEDRSAIILSQDGDFSLTSNMGDTRFLLGKQNILYFDKFFKDGAKNGKIPFYNLSGESKDTTVNYLWFDDPQHGSILDARGRGLNDDYGAFGVLRTGEASAQKNGHSLTSIRNANSETVREYLGKAGEHLAEPLTQELIGKLRKQ